MTDQDIISETVTLYFKNSHNKINCRIDIYQIDHIFFMDIPYDNFFNLITPNIVSYILNTAPNNDDYIKYKFIIHKNKKNINNYHPHLEIYLNDTINLDEDELTSRIEAFIKAKKYTDHDWIYASQKLNTLTIIQEIQKYKPGTQTFKEDKCVICITNKPNILFYECGHLIICKECYKKYKNDKCPKCRKYNDNIKLIL